MVPSCFDASQIGLTVKEPPTQRDRHGSQAGFPQIHEQRARLLGLPKRRS